MDCVGVVDFVVFVGDEGVFVDEFYGCFFSGSCGCY